MRPHRLEIAIILLPFMLASAGCVGLTAQLLYVIKGDPQIPANYTGLEDKKVAVVCVANNSSNYDPYSASTQLAYNVTSLLSKKVKNIKVVQPQKVNNWIDSNSWNQIDFREIGKGVQADMVVGIDLIGFRLHEGSTLYQGKATARVRVFDMKKQGEIVYKCEIDDFTFPANGGKHITDTNDRQFQARFVLELANHIGRHFYPHAVKEDFAYDATILE
jgi:hypothetical protein